MKYQNHIYNTSKCNRVTNRVISSQKNFVVPKSETFSVPEMKNENEKKRAQRVGTKKNLKYLNISGWAGCVRAEMKNLVSGTRTETESSECCRYDYGNENSVRIGLSDIHVRSICNRHDQHYRHLKTIRTPKKDSATSIGTDY